MAVTMEAVRDRIAHWSPRAVAGVGGLLVGLPLLGTLPAQGLLDLLLLATSGLGGAASAWVWRERRKLDHLPLELSSTALNTLVDGIPAIAVRARLGRGRPARDPEAEFSWVTPEREFPLPVLAPAPVVSGAFTFLAFDRDRVTARPGVLRVRARAQEGSELREAERLFTCLDEGRFAPQVVRRRGRLRHDPSAWERVEA